MFTSSSGTVTGPADVTDLSQPGGLGDERGSYVIGSVRRLALGDLNTNTVTSTFLVSSFVVVFQVVTSMVGYIFIFIVVELSKANII